ncbi:MAG: DUF2807 domain-containing protein [Massilia sp.]|nr:DUF2807 domain-containing protein [Massilia sp.]
MRSLLSIAAIAALSGCAIIVAPNGEDAVVHSVFGSNVTVGNGQSAHDVRAVAQAGGLAVSGPLEVIVRVGGAPRLEVDADANLLPLIRTEVAGDTLRVWVEGNVRSNNPMRVTYATPRLTQVSASGSGRLSISDLNGTALTLNKSGSGSTELVGHVSSLNVEQSGSGQLNAAALQSREVNVNMNGSGSAQFGQIQGRAFNVNLNGSGSLQAAGTVNWLNARVHGSGGVNLASLTSDQADLTTTGSGGITALVRQNLSAQATGSGHITVYGNPAQRNINGKNVQVLN